jgi:antitoxin ParD1/3/4
MPSSYAIGEHFEQFIRQQVDGGRYASASEVVRDALRLLEQEEERRAAALRALRDEVRKGVASGRGKPADEVLERLERKYTAQAQSRRSSSK